VGNPICGRRGPLRFVLFVVFFVPFVVLGPFWSSSCSSCPWWYSSACGWRSRDSLEVWLAA